MRRYILFLCSIIFFLSCNRNDDNTPSLDGECMGIADYAPPGIFYIELVDSMNDNLIQNGSYNPDQITASINGEEAKGIFRNFETTVSRDTIRLHAIGNEGSNRWLLHLSETDTDTLDFSMSNRELRYISDGTLFCGSRFLLNFASYNGNTIEFEESTSENFLKISINIVKTEE